MIEFKGWPKIARLYRDVVVTEKIDGTNAAIGIVNADSEVTGEITNSLFVQLEAGDYLIYAQSRSRIITPGTDNHGFARWVWDNAQALVDILGPGLHFGEWWGSGINRGYGLSKGEHRFSLFNTSRWSDEVSLANAVDWLRVVPIIYQGEFSTLAVKSVMEALRIGGSWAAPQFMQPEGCVVFHTAANVMFKATLENDEVPKAVAVNKPREIKNVKLLEVSADYDSPYSRENLRLAA
jgi:RNA ligase